jgi:signal transduction histidine kinase
MGAWSWDPLSGASTADERALDILGLRDGDDFFAGLESCLAPDDRPRLRQGLERDRGRAVMQLRASRRDDGRSIVIEINAGSGTGLPLGTADGAPQFIGTIQDITSRARILVERSERRAALATATTNLLHVNESSGELLAQLFDDMRAAFALASCHRFDRVGADQLTPASALGRTQESGQQPDPAMVASLSLLAAQQGVPVVRNELAAGQAGRAAPGWPITAYACYPLMAKGDVYAVLSFGTSQEHGFDDDDVDALRTLVDCLAMAEQYLQAEAEFRRFNEELEALVDARTRDVRELTANLTRAEQAERQRLAQMLHDDLQQLLHSAEMKLGLLRDDHLAGAHDSTIGYLDEVDVLLDGSVSLARRLTTDLSPQALDDNDLGEILAWLAVQMSDLHDLVVDLRLDDPIHLEDVPTRVILYQVIRELLFNVVKHADTDRASVTIEAGDSELVVEVSDDGSGFDTHALFAGRSNDGRGLHSVQQRLRLLGGELQIDSVPDGGTRVTVRCPPNSSSMLPGDG